MRIKILRLIIIGLFLLVASDLVYVQVFKGSYYYRLSKNNRIRVVPQEGWRGTITDRNGVVIAGNKVSYNVLVTPQEIKDFPELFSFLADTLKVEKKILTKRYMQRKFTPFAPVVVARDIDREYAFALEENKYRFPSLIVEEGFKRFYPKEEKLAHVVGYVGKTNRAQLERFKKYGYSPNSTIGKTGVEQFYDSYLHGVAGGSQIEVNSRGQQVRLLSLKDSKQGEDIQLTIDSELQDVLDDVLYQRPGVIIVMDMENGEILGATSSPTFNPNYFTDSQLSNNAVLLFRDSRAPLLNRITKGQYPPGSVFKIPVAIAALDQNKISQKTTFHCSGFHKVGGLKFRCAHVHGAQNLIEAIAHSCNVYFYQTGLLAGGDDIARYAKLLGLGNLTHIDLPYEKQGNIPSKRQSLLKAKRKWYTGDTLNVSIGQGRTLVTPLQLTKMMATVANYGVEVQPHLLYAISGKKTNDFLEKKKVKIPDSIFKTINQGLRATVADFSGTANVLNLQEVYVAGKTGTAQAGKKEDHSWFVGYAKGDRKNVAFCVFLEHGGSSRNACLTARQLLLKMYQKKMI